METLGLIVGISLILCASVLASARVRIEREKTLQRLIERGVSADELLQLMRPPSRAGQDLRRGLLLVGIGVSWSAVTALIGGTAWLLGIVPVSLGVIYVLFSVLDGKPR